MFLVLKSHDILTMDYVGNAYKWCIKDCEHA